MSNEAHSPDVEGFVLRQEAPLLSMSAIKDVPADFQEILGDIEGISGSWNAVEIFTPDEESIDEQQRKFFEAFDNGRDYTPTFEYSVAKKFDIEGAREKLNALMRRVLGWAPRSRVEQLARVALRAKLLDDLATCNLVDGIRTNDDSLVKDAMNRKYQPLDESLLALEDQEFQDVLSHKTEEMPLLDVTRQFTPEQITFLKKKMLSPEEQEALFTWALKSYGILRDANGKKGFRVEVTSKVQFLDVRHRSLNGATVFLKRKDMDAYSAILLLRHEIEGHARQVSNGQALFGLGGGALTLDDETLYEGLAMRLEKEAQKEYFGAEPPDPRFYAYGVKLAEEGKSFGEIFKDQYKRTLHVLLKLPLDAQLPKEISPEHHKEAKRIGWRTTYRVMRGHTDMENKEGFAMRKDLGYARGEVQDKQLRSMNKGHYNEVAVIAKGGLQLLGEFDISPEELPYKDLNLTRVFVEAIREKFHEKEALEGNGVIDIQSFVRQQAEKVFGDSKFDVKA